VRAVTVAAALSLALGACAANNSTSSGSSNTTGTIGLKPLTSLTVPADAANPAGNGQATCPSSTAIAFGGAETGANAQLGINILDGVKTAVASHNAANKNCQVQLKTYDTEGDPGKAPGIVTQMVGDSSIIGAVGLAFSGESQATGQIFQQGGLVHITASATQPALTTNGWNTFFRGLGNDNTQGPAAAKFITDNLGAKKVCVVQDDSAYGIGLSTAITQALGSADDKTCNDKVTTGQKDFSGTVNKVTNAKADAVFYSGYYQEAAPFDQQLAAKGFTGKFVGPDGVKDPKFLQLAGSAGDNAYFTCPCVPGSLVPSFTDAYKKQSGGAEPGTYSAEAYDVATILLKGIDAKNQTRATLLNYVKSYNGDGLTTHFQWNDKGELSQTAVYGYSVVKGQIEPVIKLS
jgi:branched-chain amino acid transport system substrate-binding protein